MTTANTNRPITEQEYLQMEEKSPVRHEFINGKLYEMAVGTSFHEKVIINILRFLLRHTSLEVFAQGMRVQPPGTQDYFYPDIIITNPATAKVNAITDPLLLLEILSPLTRVNDLTKFASYRQFPSLQYYLLAESKFCQITLFYRSENGEWESEIYRQPSEIIALEKLNTQLLLSEIYAGMDWAENT